jgi:hypothetical protein
MTGSRELYSQERFAPANHLGTGPFDAALRAAVRERGLTLDRLRSHLARRGIRVGLSSLSDWQHGRSRPGSAKSLQAVHALEEILGLRHAALVALLSAEERAHDNRPRTTARVSQIDERVGPIGDLAGQITPSCTDMDILARHHTIWLSETGRGVRSHSRSVVRARRDGVDRYVQRFYGERGCDLDRVRLANLHNCLLGRTAKHPTEPVMLVELLFDETLGAGETWIFESEIQSDTGEPCLEFGHAFAQPEEQYVMEVRFHPQRMPVDCHVYRSVGLGTERIRTADLTLSARNSVHLVANGLRDGVLGIAWRWS